ncbi:hypothetical protein [Gemmata obscuriglobus]|uniref:hypothetical protein n=1 Tax=Gemmata obscuriglobus TaxID=114 RepID=UPI0011CDF335|nr:hypothetical protein [Gemmata obscuriglobus]
MNHLEEEITRAWSLRNSWTPTKMRNVLDLLLQHCPSSRVDWDEGDEEWARLLCHDRLVALVCYRFPLIFILPDTCGLNLQHDLGKDIVVDSLSSFDDVFFAVDRNLLETCFGRQLTNSIDYERMSIKDIWWATV